MRFSIGALLLLLSASGLDAAPAVLDFSRSHTIEDVQRSGLKIKLLTGYKGARLAYVFEEERDVIVLLPGGRKISQKITIAHIDAVDGILTRLSLHGGVMPQDQAYQVAGMFCDSFNLSHDKLEVWYQLNFGKKYDNKPLNIYADDKYYPAVDLELFPSFSTSYPWSIRFHIQWNWTEHRGKDEEQTWRDFPTPTIPEISLNPPSGLKYDRADDFKPYIESLEAAFGQSKKAKSTRAKGSGPGGTVAPPTAAVSKDPAAPVYPGVRWWLWALGGVALISAALWLVWRAYRKKN